MLLDAVASEAQEIKAHSTLLGEGVGGNLIFREPKNSNLMGVCLIRCFPAETII